MMQIHPGLQSVIDSHRDHTYQVVPFHGHTLVVFYYEQEHAKNWFVVSLWGAKLDYLFLTADEKLNLLFEAKRLNALYAAQAASG